MTIRSPRYKKIIFSCNIFINRDNLLKHRNPGRPHIAKELLEGRYCYSFNDAFHKYLGNGSKYIVPKFQVSTKEVIEVIHRAGGLAFVAHPVYLKDDRESLDEIIGFGIDGLEVIHSLHSDVDEKHYRDIASENNLLISGGSDCHGGIKNGKILIGKFKLPFDELRSLKARVK